MPEEYKLKPTEGFVNYDPEGQLGRQCKQKEKKKKKKRAEAWNRNQVNI